MTDSKLRRESADGAGMGFDLNDKAPLGVDLNDKARCLRLRLPATSANMGPAFDAAAVALNLHLDLTARAAEEFSICARGRDAEACGRVEGNLILETYRQVLLEARPENGGAGRALRVQPLHLDVHNEIPVGMGCGSSAAARLAGIALAVEWGRLGWSDEQILSAAAALEGHPDNVTACWLGGMTVSAVSRRGDEEGAARVDVARIEVPAAWRAVIVLPRDPVRTEESRQVLPDRYARADVVENLQRCSLLVAAFASGDGGLLGRAMRDRLHEPYRAAICALLANTESFTLIDGVLGAALSGAGPAMLLIVDKGLAAETLDAELRKALGNRAAVEIVQCGFEPAGAVVSVSERTEVARRRPGRTDSRRGFE